MSGFEALKSSLAQLQRFFKEHHWKYCLIGGLAVNRWGESRFTRDIDIVVLTGVGQEEIYVDELLDEFSPRSSLHKTRQFALDHRVLLVISDAGIPIDISLGALPFEEQMLNRAQLMTIVRGQKFSVALPEDLIVMKTLAARPQDWQDIEGIVAKQQQHLDWGHIHTWLDPMLDAIERPERALELAAVRKRIAAEPQSPLRPQKKKTSSRRKKRES